MSTKVIIALTVLVMLGTGEDAYAAVPTQITVQGRLTDAGAAPRVGIFTFTFEIFDAESGGSKIWPKVPGESQTITTDDDGLWTAQLGAVIALSDNVFSAAERWLRIIVDDGVRPPEVLPRIKIDTSPFSFRVGTVDGAEGGTIVSKVSIGQGHTNTGDDAFIAGANNTAAGIASSVSGGSFNSAAGDFSSIGGGGANSTNGGFATIGGGNGNYAEGVGTVGGGIGDSAGYRSTVGGGQLNVALVDHGTVAGGLQNRVVDDGGTIAGGQWNLAGRKASVGGGYVDSAVGAFSCVPGGAHNRAFGDYSLAAGRRAQAMHHGAFVWGDSRDEDVTSSAQNEFAIRAANGLRMTDTAGSAKIILEPRYFRDNTIVAWAKVRGSDGVTGGNKFGVGNLTRNGTGNYTVYVTALSKDPAMLIPVATLEVDTPPTSALTARLIYINQVTMNTFDVYITNGNHEATDNDFVFMATMR